MIFFNALFNSGLQFGRNASAKRNILLSNQISLILSFVSFVLFLAYCNWYGWNVITIAIPLIGIFCLIGIYLNHLGFTAISRTWVSLFVPVLTISLSIYAKGLYFAEQQELDYFTFRFIMLSSCVFPFVLFSLHEKKLLVFNSLAGLSLLILHDPLHSFFGVGYHQNNLMFLSTSSYYFTNVVIFITYMFMAGALTFLKAVSEKNEKINIKLIEELNEANEELVEMNAEIEAQSMELMAQSEVLNSSQQKLLKAYGEIKQHKNELHKENKDLSAELIEKNADLVETNTELIKHNNELRQFSFTVSHNLRGPVASLLGISNILNPAKYDKEDQIILTHLKNSVTNLDVIIHDLSKIIDIRHDIFKIKQKLNLENEVKEIERLFSKEVENYKIKIKHDFGNCPELYSVKPMLSSILYNLISNSIKYRSHERQPEISITSQMGSEHYIIQVKDNGLGIDLERHKENLFKLYKRFNFQTEGKGLGLYLVKLQCESLGGSIEVRSELNKFTSFTAFIRKPENIEMQILYDEPFAKIFFDASLNSTGAIWKGPVSSFQYRTVFTKCLEFLRFYNTPNWLTDLSEQGSISKEDQLWMFQTIIPEAYKNGLKRIAAVRPDVNDPAITSYLEGIKTAVSQHYMIQEFFSDFESATEWIISENEKVAVLKDYNESIN